MLRSLKRPETWRGVEMSKVVHFEIPVDNEQRATAFYNDVLGWEVSRFGDGPYWLVRAGAESEPGADGALLARDDLHRSPVLTASVENMDDALARVVVGGGQVVQGKLPIPSMGWSAYIVDPEGNTIGLFQPDQRAGS
ncbi:MAG: VOC family protein [Actinobacteria bacterium]|nr:VOC family protein [Actinomycetota bacterium]